MLSAIGGVATAAKFVNNLSGGSIGKFAKKNIGNVAGWTLKKIGRGDLAEKHKSFAEAIAGKEQGHDFVNAAGGKPIEWRAPEDDRPKESPFTGYGYPSDIPYINRLGVSNFRPYQPVQRGVGRMRGRRHPRRRRIAQ